MRFENVRLSDIKLSTDIYPRFQPDSSKVSEYAELMEDGVKFPPIVVNARTMHLIDGFHRFQAMKRLGIIEAQVEMIDIDEDLEWLEAIRRNSQHGLPLSRKEIKAMFEKWYETVQGRVKPQDLARKLGVSTATVYRWINELEEKTGIEYQRQTHRLTDEDRERIRELREQGLSTWKIAEEMGVNQRAVWNALNDSSRRLDDENSHLRIFVNRAQETNSNLTSQIPDEEVISEVDDEIEEELNEPVIVPDIVRAKQTWEKFKKLVKLLKEFTHSDIQLLEEYFDDIVTEIEEVDLIYDWLEVIDIIGALQDFVLRVGEGVKGGE